MYQVRLTHPPTGRRAAGILTRPALEFLAELHQRFACRGATNCWRCGRCAETRFDAPRRWKLPG